MKKIIVVLLLLIPLLNAALRSHKTVKQQPMDDHELKKKWSDFKLKFGIDYPAYEEEQYRFSIFKNSVEEIGNQHYETFGFEIGLTEFAVLTDEEFKYRLGLVIPPNTPISRHVSEESNLSHKAGLPDSVDYMKLDTGIFDQSDCGSDWAFAATSVLEMKFVRSEDTLSEQELIDCVADAHGCNGGWTKQAFKYVQDFGITYDKYYPYDIVKVKLADKYAQLECQEWNYRFKLNQLQIKNFYDNTAPKCDKLKEALQTGPVAGSVYAYGEKSAWKYYLRGTLSHTSNPDWAKKDGKFQIDHAVVVMGYTPEHWIIKNSWGKLWGENGFAKIKMGDTFNICHEASWIQ